MITDKLIDAKKAGEYLGMSMHTLYKYARKGQVSSVNINGSIRFRESDIQNIIENGLPKEKEKKHISYKTYDRLRSINRSKNRIHPWQKEISPA